MVRSLTDVRQAIVGEPATGGQPGLSAGRLSATMVTLIREAGLVIGADGGTGLAFSAGRIPDLVVGDLDSLTEADRVRLADEGVPIETAPTDKDQTDGELALLAALERGADEVVLVGAIGGRLDHSLGNVGLLVAASRLGVSAWIEDDGVEIHHIGASGSLEVRDRKERTLSLVPFGYEKAQVSVSGVRWPLDGEELDLANTRALSNLITHDVCVIEVEKGAVVSLVSADT